MVLIEIPQALQREELRFILLEKNSKKPFEKDWTNTNNYKYSDEKLINHIKAGGNYGVLCGTKLGAGILVILDVDDLNILPELQEFIPKSLVIETGSLKRHIYLIAPEGTEKIILDKDNRHFGELQSTGTQCVGPGSIHPDTLNEYKIIEDLPIASITSTKLEYLKLKYTNKKIVVVESPDWSNYNKLDISSKLQITQLINTSSMKNHRDEFYGVHPLHGSTTGMNFFVSPTKNLWHCFRHNCGGDSLSYLAMKESLIQCGEKLRGEKFMKTLDIAKTKYNIVISQDDTSKLFNKPIYNTADFDPYSLNEKTNEIEIIYDNELKNLKIKKQEWLVDGLIPKGGFVIMSGKSSSFKSTGAILFSYAMSEGIKLFNDICTQKSKVLYINEELNWNLFQPQIEGIRNWVLKKETNNMCFATFQNVKIDTPNGFSSLVSVIEKQKIEVLVLDTLRRVISFEENDANAVNNFYNNVIKYLIKKYNLTIITVHHSKKDVQGTHILDSLRGSSDFVNIADSILIYRRFPGKEWFSLENPKIRGTKEAAKRIIKVNIDKILNKYDFYDITQGETKEGEIEGNQCATDVLETIKKEKLKMLKRADIRAKFENTYSPSTIDRAIVCLEAQSLLKKIAPGFYSVSIDNPFFRDATSNLTMNNIERINRSKTDSQTLL